MLVIDPRANASIRPYDLPGVGFSAFYANYRNLPLTNPFPDGKVTIGANSALYKFMSM